MTKKIVIAFDSFKGSMTSGMAAQAAQQAIAQLYPSAAMRVVSIADGGEGTVAAIASAMAGKAKWHHCQVTAPMPSLGSVLASYITTSNGTAIMELAAASGLTLVPLGSRNVMQASTLGTGEMMLDAISNGCTRIALGLGGSATCDAGMGMLAALGYRFLDENSCELCPCGQNMLLAHAIDASHADSRLRNTAITLLTDVDSPLYGPRGAAYVFAPQKGASPQHVKLLDDGLRAMARLAPSQYATMPGTGAAGGTGWAAMAWLNAAVKPGIDEVLRIIDFNNIIKDASLIITGEGRIDAQTAMGKAPGGVLRAGRKHGIPVIAIGGSVASGVTAQSLGFNAIYGITPPNMPLATAMQPSVAARNLAATMKRVIPRYM